MLGPSFLLIGPSFLIAEPSLVSERFLADLLTFGAVFSKDDAAAGVGPSFFIRFVCGDRSSSLFSAFVPVLFLIGEREGKVEEENGALAVPVAGNGAMGERGVGGINVAWALTDTPILTEGCEVEDNGSRISPVSIASNVTRGSEPDKGLALGDSEAMSFAFAFASPACTVPAANGVSD